MLAILTSHPIQYQAPLWRAMHESVKIPMRVWFLSDHGQKPSSDKEFGNQFAWDIDLLSGYPHDFLPMEPGGDLKQFRGIKLKVSWESLFRTNQITHLWVEGWRFKAMWEAVRVAKRLGICVWMRGESNDLKRDSLIKGVAKRFLLGRHLRNVDQFLCIGSANRRLYLKYGIEESRLAAAPYCVDNDLFGARAELLRPQRAALRERWNIPADAFCILFCGKFIAKKRPQDLVAAVTRLIQGWSDPRPIHLLMVGTGALDAELRRQCHVVYDWNALPVSDGTEGPSSSFAGFLNQSQIAEAYVASDLLVLPSDANETWGLVVNEAMACGTPAVVSDQCGCAEDLPSLLHPQFVFPCGNTSRLAESIAFAAKAQVESRVVAKAADSHHIRHTIDAAINAYSQFAKR